MAFTTDDVVATARALRAAGAPLLPVPANYAADLDARFDLDPELLAAVGEHGPMYDEDDSGSYLQLATEVLGDRVFSRWCSGGAATTGTDWSTPRYGWPHSAE
ncbi:MAG: putative 4-hydroxyphenylpyruvate dioxygenase containing a TIM-barrel fold (N-ter) [Modestobacter sp.]|nr:putative 4-hydroxyphenylpyruvate dioxygenase containing a TIM-barrel fold (N-ter) [Modestobacter sp.]